MGFETHCTANHWPNKCDLHEKPHGMKEKKVSDIRDPMVRSLIGVEMLKSRAFRYLADSGTALYLAGKSRKAHSRELHSKFKPVTKETRGNKKSKDKSMESAKGKRTKGKGRKG